VAKFRSLPNFTAVLSKLCLGHYRSVESRASKLWLRLMNARNLCYLLWAVLLLGIGLLDIEISFKPLGTVLLAVLTGAAYLYRHIIKAYFQFIEVSRSFLVVSLVAIALNLSIGFLLNDRLHSKAQDLIHRINGYRDTYGRFPQSLLEVAHDSERQGFQRDRVYLGARVAYQSDGRTFYFSYDRYPAGELTWNPKLNEFQASLD
jgi:hypothetical protein